MSRWDDSKRLLRLKVHCEHAKMSGMNVYDVQVTLFKNGHGHVALVYPEPSRPEYKQFHWRWDPKWQTIVTRPQSPGSLDHHMLQSLNKAYEMSVKLLLEGEGQCLEMMVPEFASLQ